MFGVPVSPTNSITTAPATTGIEGKAYTYQIQATGNPLPVFSLVSGPSGMSVDRVSGVLTWTVPTTAVGAFPVTVSASNVLGGLNLPFTINVRDTIAPTTPGAPILTALGTTSATISWGASSDNVGVTGYSVYWIYQTGHSGRGGGVTTHTILEATTNGSTTTATITGLTARTSYNFYVRANDAAGNVSGLSAPVNVIPGMPPYNFAATEVGSAPNYSIYVVANHSLGIQLSSTSFATPTYSILNAPAGMTVDPNTGLVAWTPSASYVGVDNVTFQSTNTFGTTSLTVAINVTADVPVPGFVFTNTSSPTFSVVGFPIGLQITDASNTPSTYSIVSAPSDVSIDPNTGVVNWTPTAAELPSQTLSFQLTNSAGTAQITVNPSLYISDAPQNVTITGADSSSAMLTWQPPVYNDNLVTGYHILVSEPNYGQYDFTTDASTFSAAMIPANGTGTYYVNIQAIGASGQGLWTTVAYPLNPSYTITSGNGGPSGPVGQPVSIQLSDWNAFTPSTWSLVSGPAGMTVNPTTGMVTWTPTAAQLGPQTITFQESNSSIGTAEVSLTYVVLFADGTFASAPQNVAVTGSSSDPVLTWSAPSNVLAGDPVASYEIEVTDSLGNVFTYYVSSPTTAFDLSILPATGNGKYTATVLALDATGNSGAASAPVSFNFTFSGDS